MDSATRKRKTLSDDSEASTSSIVIKTRRLDDSSNSTISDRVSTTTLSCWSSDEQLASKCVNLEEHENEITVEFTGSSAGDSLNCSDRRETSEVDGELESTDRPHESSFQRLQKMPSETELEEFFAAAEKTIQKQFMDKYNFDIVKDEPLEGRYEWVQLQVKP